METVTTSWKRMAGVVAGGGSGGLMRRSTALPQQQQQPQQQETSHAAVHLQHRSSLPPLSMSFVQQQEQQRKEFLMDLQRNRQRHSSWLRHYENDDEQSMSLQQQLSQSQNVSKDSDDWKDNPSLSYWMQGLDDQDQDDENDGMMENAKNEALPLSGVDAKSGKESPQVDSLSKEYVSDVASVIETPGADQDDDARPSSPISSTNALFSDRHPPASPVSSTTTTDTSLVSSPRQDQASPTNTTKPRAQQHPAISSPVSVMDPPRTVVLSSSSTLRQYKIQQIKQDLQARRRAARKQYSSSKDQHRVSKVDHTMVLRDGNMSNDGSSSTTMIQGHYSGPLNEKHQMHGPGIFCSQDGRLYVGEFRANVFWQGVVSQGRLSSTTSNKTKTRRRQRTEQRVQV